MAELKKLRSGKVRDLYAYGDELWLVASDRLSAFDVILPNPIPGKGKILTQLARHWFQHTHSLCPNHVIGYDLPTGVGEPDWAERTVRTKRCEVIPVECVARGYVAGSGWKEYQQCGTVGGFKVPAGLLESAQLPQPLFTPATKAEEGHDQNLTEAEARQVLGDARYEQLRDLTLAIYTWAADYAAKRGIIIADTKFEFGLLEGQVILIDEILTPDSSRFWEAKTYAPGKSQPSYDKQFVRDYLETLDWNKQAPGPELPPVIVQKTLAKYQEAYDRLVGAER
jgi:phosphoribosylaminoimidazole-succinocarboxamide synthase